MGLLSGISLGGLDTGGADPLRVPIAHNDGGNSLVIEWTTLEPYWNNYLSRWQKETMLWRALLYKGHDARVAKKSPHDEKWTLVTLAKMDPFIGVARLMAAEYQRDEVFGATTFKRWPTKPQTARDELHKKLILRLRRAYNTKRKHERASQEQLKGLSGTKHKLTVYFAPNHFKIGRYTLIVLPTTRVGTNGWNVWVKAGHYDIGLIWFDPVTEHETFQVDGAMKKLPEYVHKAAREAMSQMRGAQAKGEQLKGWKSWLS